MVAKGMDSSLRRFMSDSGMPEGALSNFMEEAVNGAGSTRRSVRPGKILQTCRRTICKR
jgi:hypothetical protein